MTGSRFAIGATAPLVVVAGLERSHRRRRPSYQGSGACDAAARGGANDHRFLQPRACVQLRCGVQLPGRRRGWQRYLFGVIAIGAACLIVWLLRRGGDRLYCAGLSLILGGALGNLCDRITLGKVVDFLSFHHFMPFRHSLINWLDPFPAFNIADSAITVGAALLILDGFRRRPDPSVAAK